MVLSMPEWFEALRPEQERAVGEVVNLWSQGVRNVILSAPPGTGKSIMSIVAASGYTNGSILYACTTKDLQDQLQADFDWPVVKGRSNFVVGENSFGKQVTAADCTRMQPTERCAWSCGTGLCPYKAQKDVGMEASSVIMNYAFVLSLIKSEAESMEPAYPGLCFRDAYIFDEADELPELLCNNAGVTVNGNIGRAFADAVSDINEESIANLAETALRASRDEVERLKGYASYGSNAELKKKVQRFNEQASALEWIVQVEQRSDRPSFSFAPLIYSGDLVGGSFKAINSSWVAKRDLINLLNPDSVRLFMSGSLRPEEFARQMNFDLGDWGTVVMNHPAPAANRVVVLDAADGARLPRLTAKVLGQHHGIGPPVTLTRLRHWLDKFPDERVLIHHSSGLGARKLSEYLLSVTQRPVFNYASGNAAKRCETKQQWLDSPNGVLVAQSMGRGHDFADDSCRAQIIYKVSVPVFDRMTRDRMEQDSGFLAKSAAASTVQQIGRVCRGERDYGITVILDDYGRTILNEKLSPDFVVDALAHLPSDPLVFEHAALRKAGRS